MSCGSVGKQPGMAERIEKWLVLGGPIECLTNGLGAEPVFAVAAQLFHLHNASSAEHLQVQRNGLLRRVEMGRKFLRILFTAAQNVQQAAARGISKQLENAGASGVHEQALYKFSLVCQYVAMPNGARFTPTKIRGGVYSGG